MKVTLRNRLLSGTPDHKTDRAQRVTILGMARQGTALARYFLSHGARVTLSDVRTAASLAPTCNELSTWAAAAGRVPDALRFALGGHPLELLEETDLLCLSGGVSPAIPIAQRAIARGLPLSNDALLVLQNCPVPVIGITGSAGKTTTTTLAALMLEKAGYRVHLGGNIGVPLIDKLDSIAAGDKVVMELSSFQLELCGASPAIGAILNITPNHLDRHPSMSHYAAAKANLLRFQLPGDSCVLNADDPFTGPWLHSGRCTIAEGIGQAPLEFPLRGDRIAFSLTGEVESGAFLRDDVLVWRVPGLPDATICRSTEIRLRGRHNLANVLAACCVAGAAGACCSAMAAVATSFAGVEHRLEIVRERNGILWVNDSIATTPERAVAALRAFKEPIVLLAGGRDKHLPWQEFAAVAGQRARHVILFGEAASLIAQALSQHAGADAGPMRLSQCRDLPSAIFLAEKVAQPGDVVLLAPGGTSFDAYVDFAERGQHFRDLVKELP